MTKPASASTRSLHRLISYARIISNAARENRRIARGDQGSIYFSLFHEGRARRAAVMHCARIVRDALRSDGLLNPSRGKTLSFPASPRPSVSAAA